MSLTRSTAQELCLYVQSKSASVLGNKFFDCRLACHVDVSAKSDKYEPKIFAISKFRIFFLHGKSPSSLKVERFFHILSLRSLHMFDDKGEVAISFDEPGGNRRRLTLRCNAALSSCTAESLALNMLSALKRYFPDVGPRLSTIVEVSPQSVLAQFPLLTPAVPRPAHSFRRTYAALCDFYDQPYREEVSWDVEKIYAHNQLTELRLEDFSHLLPKDLLPVVGALQYSTYFTGLIVEGLRMTVELIDVVLGVIRSSQTLSKLHLRNCVLPKDFVHAFSTALQQNPNLPLESLDLSKNAIDDKKGFTQLALIIPRLNMLRNLCLAECSLSDKSIQLLSSGLAAGLTPSPSSPSLLLHTFQLSSNSLKDDVACFTNLLSLSTGLRVLQLMDTSFPLDKLWPALKYGGLQLNVLHFGGCQAGKKTPENAQSIKEFFSSAVALQSVVFSGTGLPAELLKALLLGLASNTQLEPFELVLDAVVKQDHTSCAQVLESCIGGIRMSSLSIRDNGLEAEMSGILTALTQVPSLRKLDIGGANFTGVKRTSKQSGGITTQRILLDVVKLVSDDSHVVDLCLSDAHLGGHLSVLLNTLGSVSGLHSLDISGNDIGNFGARILSKALQLNVSLKCLSIDRNGISAEGFADIAFALKTNRTLLTIPYPVADVTDNAARADKSRLFAAVSEIEAALDRNRDTTSQETAFYRKAMFKIDSQSGDDGEDGWTRRIEEGLQNSRLQTVTKRDLESLVNPFIDQVHREGEKYVQRALEPLRENFLQFNGIEDCVNDRLSKEILGRLKERIENDIHTALLEWKWRELTELGELLVKKAECSSSASPRSEAPDSPASRFVERKGSSGPACRPKSIVAELASNGEHQESTNLDTPPKPSQLQHLAKTRPKAARRLGKSNGSTDSTEKQIKEEDNCTEIQDNTVIRQDIPLGSPKCNARMQAMLPPKVLNELSLATSKTTEPEQPPPIPRRSKGAPAVPPSLPPKPATATDQSEGEPGSRRSVADMAKMFSTR